MKKNKYIFIIFVLIAINVQQFNLSTENYFKTPLPNASNKTQESNYTYIWDEFANTSGNLPGDDILLYGETFGPFHNYLELITKLSAMNDHFPGYINLFNIGVTNLGNQIWGICLTNESEIHQKSEMLIVAQHHAREQITVENALYFIDKILFSIASNQDEYSHLLSEKEIYIIPSLNIDGGSIIYKNPWHRKTLPYQFTSNYSNLSEVLVTNTSFEVQDVDGDGYINAITPESDSNWLILSYEGIDYNNDSIIGDAVLGGVDPNRNYDYEFNDPRYSSTIHSSAVYCGPAAFSENCTMALKEFIEEHSFVFSISLHSGIAALYYPGYSKYQEETQQPIYDYKDVIYNFTRITKIESAPVVVSAGMFSPWAYHKINSVQLAFCLETYGNQSALTSILNTSTHTYSSKGIWDYFNPPANEVMSQSENIFNGLLYFMSLDFSQTQNIRAFTRVLPIIGLCALLLILKKSGKKKAQFKRNQSE